MTELLRNYYQKEIASLIHKATIIGTKTIEEDNLLMKLDHNGKLTLTTDTISDDIYGIVGIYYYDRLSQLFIMTLSSSVILIEKDKDARILPIQDVTRLTTHGFYNSRYITTRQGKLYRANCSFTEFTDTNHLNVVTVSSAGKVYCLQ